MSVVTAFACGWTSRFLLPAEKRAAFSQSEDHSKASGATASQAGFPKRFEEECVKICAFQTLSSVTKILIYVLIDLQKLQKPGSVGTWVRGNLMIK